MKKSLLLPTMLLLWTSVSSAQCTEPTQLPYIENSDTATPGFLPECMETFWSSFASSNVFEVVEGPVDGFQGNVIAYDTTIDPASGMATGATVNARLTTPKFAMTQGMGYMVYFLYRNSDSNFSIDEVKIYLDGTDVVIGTLTDISDATPTNFISAFFTPPATGIYSVSVVVNTEGSQGSFYLDSFMVNQTGALGRDSNKFEALTVFPNPVQDVLYINNDFGLDTISVFNAAGQLVLNDDTAASNAVLSLGHLSSGVYFLDIMSGEQRKRTKLIKQ